MRVSESEVGGPLGSQRRVEFVGEHGCDFVPPTDVGAQTFTVAFALDGLRLWPALGVPEEAGDFPKVRRDVHHGEDVGLGGQPTEHAA